MKNRKESAADMFYDRFCEDYRLRYRDPGENGNVRISSYRIDDLGYVTLVRFQKLFGICECGVFTPVMKDTPAIAFTRKRGLFGSGTFTGEVYKLIPDKLELGKNGQNVDDIDGKIWDFFNEAVRKTAYGEKRTKPFDLSKMENGETLSFLCEKLGNRYDGFVKRFLVPES